MNKTEKSGFLADMRDYLEICRAFQIRWVHIAVIFVLQVITTLFEGVGLGLVVPILHLMSGGGPELPSAATGAILDAIRRAFAAIGLPFTLEVLLVCVALLLIIRQTFLYLRTVMQLLVQEQGKRNMRNLLFARYMQADLSYQDRESSGNMLNALMTETQNSTTAIVAPIMMLNVTIIGLFYFVAMLMISFSMTFVSFATLASAMFLMRTLMLGNRQAGMELAEVNRRITDFLVGRLQSLRLVRLTGNENAEMEQVRAINKRLYGINLRLISYGAALGVAIEPIVVTAALVIVYFGTKSFGMSFAELGLFILILLRLMPVSKDMVSYQQQFVAGLGTLRSLRARLADLERAREDRSGNLPPPKLKSGIRLEGVHFSYPESSLRGAGAALRGIDLLIPAGQVTALVGPSGAGKSTLIDLLPRLRNPTKGRILFDETPVAEMDVAALRSAIAYVPQSPRILEATPASHIRYGAANLGQAAVEEAAMLAGAHDFIMRLPRGYDTPLGEEGRMLSGGERQRLDLARALATSAPILVLDEPTSNLDAESEFKLQESLTRLRARGDLTVIVIAHRLVTIVNADQIVVMREGRIEASGAHSALLASSAWYAESFARQSGGGVRERAATSH